LHTLGGDSSNSLSSSSSSSSSSSVSIVADIHLSEWLRGLQGRLSAFDTRVLSALRRSEVLVQARAGGRG
jgi:hypothetical protein